MIIRAYTEVESGKRADRPELAKALSDCKRSKATLVIAKLARPSRTHHLACSSFLFHCYSRAQLTSDGYTTRRGLPWNKQQVKRVIERCGGLPNATN